MRRSARDRRQDDQGSRCTGHRGSRGLSLHDHRFNNQGSVAQEVDVISQRQVYREELLGLMESDADVVCLEADLGGQSNAVQLRFPARYINVGIAEHTMLNIAAGLCKEGFKPFASTFAPFGVLRACECMKLVMGYMGLPVKLVCPYAGVSGAWFGPTHQCLEDFAIVSSFAGIAMGAPHGEMEARDMVRWAHAHPGAVYLRMGRNGRYKTPRYLDPLSYPFPRRGAGWSPDNLVTLVTVGEIGTELGLGAIRVLTGAGVEANHLHMPFVDALYLDATLRCSLRRDS